jgi:hypothetical protein
MSRKGGRDEEIQNYRSIGSLKFLQRLALNLHCSVFDCKSTGEQFDPNLVFPPRLKTDTETHVY